MAYRGLAQAVATLHYAILAFIVFGGFLTWRWPRLIWLHLLAVAWAIAIVTVPGLLCPLTVAENWSRQRAGLPVYASGFIDHYIEGVLYPAGFTPLVQVLVGLTVLGSWVGLVVRRRRAATTATGRT